MSTLIHRARGALTTTTDKQLLPKGYVAINTAPNRAQRNAIKARKRKIAKEKRR